MDKEMGNPDFPYHIFELMKPEGFEPGRYEWVLRQDPKLVELAHHRMRVKQVDFRDVDTPHGYFVGQLKKLIKESKK
jgi:hypothetical protein